MIFLIPVSPVINRPIYRQQKHINHAVHFGDLEYTSRENQPREIVKLTLWII